MDTITSGTLPHWIDCPQVEIQMEVPIYVADLWVGDVNVVVTMYRQPGFEAAIGMIELVGWALNGQDCNDPRCVPIKSGSSYVEGRSTIQQPVRGYPETHETLIAAQVIRQLDVRHWASEIEDRLCAVERDWGRD